MFGYLISAVRRTPRGYSAYLLVAAATVLTGALLGNSSLKSYVSFSLGSIRFVVWIFPVLIWYSIVATKIAMRRVPKPTKTLVRLTRINFGWLARGTALLAVYVPFTNAISVIKSAIPRVNPFYADPMLVDFDRAIFGTDPWRITHSFVGPIGTLIIDRVYDLWFFALPASLAWLAFTRDSSLQQRGFLSLALIWTVLGCALAMGLSSVGPCFFDDFYHSDYFSPLMDQIRQIDSVHPLGSVVAMHYLLATRGSLALGSGISAMPSTHVALALFFVFVMNSSVRQKWPVWGSIFFFLIILFGSVHLGWHYAADGIVAIVGTSVIWIASGWFVSSGSKKSEPAMLGRTPMPIS